MRKSVTPKEVEMRMKKGETIHIIDVRESSEVATGKIPGALHIPLGQLALRQGDLDKAKSYIITCQSGNRSKAACGLMEALGYSVEDMAGGMNEWIGETKK